MLRKGSERNFVSRRTTDFRRSFLLFCFLREEETNEDRRGEKRREMRNVGREERREREREGSNPFSSFISALLNGDLYHVIPSLQCAISSFITLPPLFFQPIPRSIVNSCSDDGKERLSTEAVIRERSVIISRACKNSN